jgi:hypothetical protein
LGHSPLPAGTVWGGNPLRQIGGAPEAGANEAGAGPRATPGAAVGELPTDAADPRAGSGDA